jgi:hypothetical protein
LKIINFRRNYADSFKSLKDLSEKIRSLDSGNGHHRRDDNNNDDNDDDNKHHRRRHDDEFYPGIKLPSKEFVMSFIIDNPGLEKLDDLVKIMLHRMYMRHQFPSKFKSRAHATGKKYEFDEYEEYDPTQLNVEELKTLQQQREHRRRKGRITSIEEIKEGDKKGVVFELGRDMPNGEVEPLTDEEAEYYWLQPNKRWQDPNYHW